MHTHTHTQNQVVYGCRVAVVGPGARNGEEAPAQLMGCSALSPPACGHRAAASPVYLINLPQVLPSNMGSAGLSRDVAGE